MKKTALEITHTDEDDVTIVYLKGEMWGRPGEPELFRSKMGELVANSRFRVVFDLSEVRLISSTGIGMLVGAFKTVSNHDGRMAIAEPSDPIKPVFRVLKAPFPVFYTHSDAMAFVRGQDT